MEEIKLSDYLGDEKLECSTLLSRVNWERLLNSDSRITKILEEWDTFNLKINIKSLVHMDTSLRSPKEIGYANYFFDDSIKMYKSYVMSFERDPSLDEMERYGELCLGVVKSIDLPLSMCLTVIRADIQRRDMKNILKEEDVEDEYNMLEFNEEYGTKTTPCEVYFKGVSVFTIRYASDIKEYYICDSVNFINFSYHAPNNSLDFIGPYKYSKTLEGAKNNCKHIMNSYINWITEK